MRILRTWLMAAATLITVANVVGAQGVQTGTITGAVKSADGLSVPGVTVTVASPALQGLRSAGTDVNGVYSIKGLPAGPYSITFEISSFKTVKKENVDLAVGGTVEVNQIMALAGVTETVTVSGTTVLAPIANPTLSQAYTKRDLDPLPVGRTPSQIADLAPGLTSNTPNAGQVTISGGFAYDNVFMVNGVDVNDNLFGSAHNLFIEDAIQETNILTGSISAEFGRFSGGVINIVTKSGGNAFSGSFRDNLSKPSWIKETPREVANNIKHSNVLSKTYEGTLGGPIVRDKVWFFVAGRHELSNTSNTFAETNRAYTTINTNNRAELKGTGTFAPGQTAQVSFINDPSEGANTSGLSGTLLADPKDLVTRQLPNHLFAANYNGVLGSRFFVTGQYSEKTFGFRNSGGTSTAIIDSPFRTRGVLPGVPNSLFYNAPYFDSTDPEDRNNRQLTGSLSYLWSTGRFGTHDLKGGAEQYQSTRTGGNSQTATGYVFRSDYLFQNGQPVVDAGGSPIPVFIPGTSRLENWLPQRGARIDIKTTSLYIQDRWTASSHLTLDLGTRFEAVRSNATGEITTVSTNAIVPRLGASYDVKGDGQTVLQLGYAHYAGKYSEAQFARNTQVGNPSVIVYRYNGPAGQGTSFAAGMDPANYSTIIGGGFPTANIFNASGLRSPITREVTAAVGRQLGRRAFVKGTYLFRTWTHFVEDFIDLSNGVTPVTRNGVNYGTFTNVVYKNTDVPKREYDGIVLQSGYRLNDRLTFGGHYTLELKNDGQFEGEGTNTPGSTSIYGDFPEIYAPALDRLFPTGHLADYQRHKLRVYGTYSQRLGRFGSVDVSPIWRMNSGTTYSLIAANVPLSAVELARNPGYPVNDISPSTAQSLYYGDRGQYPFKGFGLLDLAATYGIPVWKSARPWIKVELFNLLNDQKLIKWNTTVTPDPNSPKDANGLPTGYIQGSNFGKATQDNNFPQPLPGTNGGRLFRMAFGVRF